MEQERLYWEGWGGVRQRCGVTLRGPGIALGVSRTGRGGGAKKIPVPTAVVVLIERAMAEDSPSIVAARMQ